MPYLSRVNITFNTHKRERTLETIIAEFENVLDFTRIHVFVKNRTNTSFDPEEHSSFTENLLAYEELYDLENTYHVNEHNPYLAFIKGFGSGIVFSNGSSHSVDLTLRPGRIPIEEVILPVVNVHLLPGSIWNFDYTVLFEFDDGKSFSHSSNYQGVKGIMLDNNNPDHSGICIENPYTTIPLFPKPVTSAKLVSVILEFYTHNYANSDDDKRADTVLNVHIVNRLAATSSSDIAIGLDIFKNEAFPKDSYKSIVLTPASTNILLADMMLPEIFIVIAPVAQEKWNFDYRVTFVFENLQTNGIGADLNYSSRTNGIILNQDNNKYSGVYQGNSFPTASPSTIPLQTPLPVHKIKRISLDFLQQKFDEFINSSFRQAFPLFKLLFHNSGAYPLSATPESYVSLRSLIAVKGNQTTYTHSATNLGFLGKGDYFNDINSKSITLKLDTENTLNVDTSKFVPFLLRIDFETEGWELHSTAGWPTGSVASMDFTKFHIILKLTLTYDEINKRLDAFSWISDLEAMQFYFETDENNETTSYSRGNFLGKSVNDINVTSKYVDYVPKVIDVYVHTTHNTEDGTLTFENKMQNQIYDKLTEKDPFTNETIADSINSIINSMLLGGTIEETLYTANNFRNVNKNIVNSFKVENNNMVIDYSGPNLKFDYRTPADWPNASTNPDSIYDFSPGNLANIEHIVVLTMENRSFDHILGYLSLPVSENGMGRTDVDGLRGGESNPYKDNNYPSVLLTDTAFAPDPPHGYEPVHNAINNGRMDGFVDSFAKEHGDQGAGNIMGYHNGLNVPVYDALARDFAICHRWFASHPGPTFCNRFYELTGRLNMDAKGFWELDNSSPKQPSFTKTIFDYLSSYQYLTPNLTWKYFEHAYCFLRLFENYTFDSDNIVSIDDAENGFFACASSGTLPSVSFIDPHYIEFPPNANCDGPPADIKDGQEFVQKVVEAVISSPNWEKTLLIITYDEHGGFYDHVAPPNAPKISDESPIETLGVRVPAFIISPWAKQSGVFGHDATNSADSLHFDHTSILKTIARCFMSEYPPYMGPRYANANDLSQVLNNEIRSSTFLPFIRYNIVYNVTQKSLDVRGGNTAPGTMIWQYNVNNTEAQNFSFEDAGDDFFYIRTHRGNLYLTVDVPALVVVVPANDEGPSGIPDFQVKQDVKYHENINPVGGLNPAFQKWKLHPPDLSVANNGSFVITNAFFTNKVLQPVNNQSGATVVLGDPDPANSNTINTNTWKITIRQPGS